MGRISRTGGAVAAIAVALVCVTGCTSSGGGVPGTGTHSGVTGPSSTGTAHASPSGTARPDSASPPTSQPVRLARFTGGGVSFEYPAAWHPRKWAWASSFSALITYLSPSRLRDPCTVTTTAKTTSATCGYPMGALPAGGVLVTWTADGFPAGLRATVNARIGGYPAVETTTRPGTCAGIGGTETITARIVPTSAAKAAAADNWFTMTACLRAPSVRLEQDVRDMLASFVVIP